MPSRTRQLSQYANVVSFVTSNNNLVVANSVVFPDGTSQSTAGLSITRTVSIANANNYTINSANTDMFVVTALSTPFTLNIPTGGPTNGQKLMIRIKDNGTPRNLTWNSASGGYRVVGTALPANTTASKLIYVGAIYNSTETYWDVVSVGIQS